MNEKSQINSKGPTEVCYCLDRPHEGQLSQLNNRGFQNESNHGTSGKELNEDSSPSCRSEDAPETTGREHFGFGRPYGPGDPRCSDAFGLVQLSGPYGPRCSAAVSSYVPSCSTAFGLVQLSGPCGSRCPAAFAVTRDITRQRGP